MSARYEPPEYKVDLTNEEIHRRYQDTSLLIHKEYQPRTEVSNYLSYGSSRRTIEYSSYGNQPVIIRRPVATESQLASQVLRIYRKPQENCTIS